MPEKARQDMIKLIKIFSKSIYLMLDSPFQVVYKGIAFLKEGGGAYIYMSCEASQVPLPMQSPVKTKYN